MVQKHLQRYKIVLIIMRLKRITAVKSKPIAVSSAPKGEEDDSLVLTLNP
jgi:hypothetical protein